MGRTNSLLAIAILDLWREFKRKKSSLLGHDQVRYSQVLEFMRLQRLGLTKPFWKLPRMEIAAMIDATSEKGRRVALRIIHLEWRLRKRKTNKHPIVY